MDEKEIKTLNKGYNLTINNVKKIIISESTLKDIIDYLHDLPAVEIFELNFVCKLCDILLNKEGYNKGWYSILLNKKEERYLYNILIRIGQTRGCKEGK